MPEQLAAISGGLRCSPIRNEVLEFVRDASKHYVPGHIPSPLNLPYRRRQHRSPAPHRVPVDTARQLPGRRTDAARKRAYRRRDRDHEIQPAHECDDTVEVAALADRFAYVVAMPAWASLTEAEQLAIIKADDAPVAPADECCLVEAIARTRASLELIRTDLGEGVAAYVRTLVALLAQAGIARCGSRSARNSSSSRRSCRDFLPCCPSS